MSFRIGFVVILSSPTTVRAFGSITSFTSSDQHLSDHAAKINGRLSNIGIRDSPDSCTRLSSHGDLQTKATLLWSGLIYANMLYPESNV